MTMIVPDSMPQEKVKDLLERGTIVERDGLEHLAEEGYQAAVDALEVVRKNEHEGLEALVVIDPDEEALVVLWRQK